MDYTAFAHRVLFARSWQDKLDPPRKEELQSEGSSPVSTTFLYAKGLLPGRPDGLECKVSSQKSAPLPAEAKLINERSRAHLLHFFCNHELLAVELMALALLKFPFAANQFKQNLLHTLLEEQQHTTWYLQRLRQLGLEFCSQPLSKMIWDAIAPMTSPLDYVSRLSLTFEQANLDYAFYYQKLLREVGDTDSAAILARIYRDEIRHVNTGIHWLREWKHNEEEDFSAWQRTLDDPQFMIRAKGNIPFFNCEGRKKAGLDAHFIEQVQLATGSRGRSPDLWSFDPLAELYWADPLQKPASSTARLQKIQAELSSVLFCFAHKEDFISTPLEVTKEERKAWADVGLLLPRTLSPDKEIPKIRQHHTWAVTPATAPVSWRDFFDKEVTAQNLRAFCVKQDICSQELDSAFQFETINSKEEFEEKIAQTRLFPLVLKAPFAASGHGVRIVESREQFSTSAIQRFLEHVLATQKRLLLFPFFDLVLEGSAHYDVKEDGTVVWQGLTWIKCSSTGKFQKTTTGSHPFRLPLLTEELRKFCYQDSNLRPSTYRWCQKLLPLWLGTYLAAKGYVGPVGIDFFIYKDHKGELALHPLNDLNPRRSFGRAAIQLRKKLGVSALSLEIVSDFNSQVEQNRNATSIGAEICLALPGAQQQEKGKKIVATWPVK